MAFLRLGTRGAGPGVGCVLEYAYHGKKIIYRSSFPFRREGTVVTLLHMLEACFILSHNEIDHTKASLTPLNKQQTARSDDLRVVIL